MGWLSKAGVIVIGLVLFGLGLWPVSAIAFAYVFLSMGRRRKRSASDPKGAPHRTIRFTSKARVVGMALLAASFLAFLSGGILSPLVFGGLALLALLSPGFALRGFANRVRPVEGSILLCSAFFPLRWYSLVEVKPGPAGPTRALSALEEKLILFGPDSLTAYLLMDTISTTARGAEEKVTARLRELARQVSSRGVYFLPLTSEDAASKLGTPLSQINLDPVDVFEGRGAPFDILVLRPEGRFVVGVGAYSRTEAKAVKPSIPSASKRLRSEPLLWEVLEKLGERQQWPAPDAYSSFLNALQLTKGEPIGERISSVSQSAATVRLQSAGGTSVELSRAQLRALMKIYG